MRSKILSYNLQMEQNTYETEFECGEYIVFVTKNYRTNPFNNLNR